MKNKILGLISFTAIIALIVYVVKKSKKNNIRDISKKDYTLYYGKVCTIEFKKTIPLYYVFPESVLDKGDRDSKVEDFGKGRLLVGVLGKGIIEGETATITNASYKYPVSFLLSDIANISVQLGEINNNPTK